MEHRQLIVGGVIGAFALVAGLWLWSQPGEPEKSSPATTPRTELAPAPPPPPPMSTPMVGPAAIGAGRGIKLFAGSNSSATSYIASSSACGAGGERLTG